MRLKDKVCIITGANSGIGKTTTLRFLKEGAIVIACGRNTNKLEKLVEDANNNSNLKTFSMDVTDRKKINEVVNEVKDSYGKIDVLINNAGINNDNLLIRMKEEEWDKVIDINLKGTFNMTQAIIPTMLKARKGSIISTSSVVGIYGNPGQANYSASKAGLIGFTKSVAKEYAKRNIRANVVAPGFFNSQMTDNMSEAAKKKIQEAIPMQRIGDQEELANTFVFLASDESSYITSQVIEVSGGLVF